MKGARYYFLRKPLEVTRSALVDLGYEELPGSGDGEKMIMDSLTKTFWTANEDDFAKCRNISIERDMMDIKEIEVKDIKQL